MKQQFPGTLALSERSRSLQELIRSMRKILGRGDLESEDHRKAALRRLLHGHAAGLTSAEIEELVVDLRGHFPDRIFESVSSARGLASRTADLEKDVSRLREERNRLRQRVDHLGSLMTRLARAAETPAGQRPDATARVRAKRTLTKGSQEAVVAAAELCFTFVLNQEATAQSIEETLGRGSTSSPSRSLTTLLPHLVEGKLQDRELLEAIRQRLRLLQMLPGALMTGAQQSWKGGTQEILEHLDPKATRSNILKYPAMLKEIEKKFEQFWNHFDRNVEHYYRSRFERVYRDKMEDGP